MGVRPGYKQTEVGVIPEDWEVKPLSQVSDKIMVGIASAATHAYRAKGVPLFRNQNIKSGRLDDSDLLFIAPEYESSFRNKRLQGGDLLTIRTGYPGVTAIVPQQYDGAQSFTTLITRPKKNEVDGPYLCHFINSEKGQKFFSQSQIGGAQKNVNAGTLRGMLVPLPSHPEQRAIAEALRDVDGLLAALDRLIAKKRDLKQAAMQQLLTGQTRLPGFHGEWEVKQIAEIATSTPDKNSGGATLPVLTCSKHLGFVDSLGYFKNQVFSKDLSTYKIIRRGQIGYPANHIEEGSIGLQDLYDVAVVSPIYVVFSVVESVNSFFLHRVLKLESYREKFKVATTSSVDRRGSLRWPAFSKITVALPPPPEQTAIAEVLSDMDAELATLEQRREKTRLLKQAMMQELLTGRTRLVPPGGRE